MSLENIGKKIDGSFESTKAKVEEEMSEVKSVYSNLDNKERKWLKYAIYIVCAIVLMLSLVTCVAMCSKPKMVTVQGQQYQVDQNGIPYAQNANGGYAPAPGYEGMAQQIQPQQHSGVGTFLTGALAGAGVTYFATRNNQIQHPQPPTVINKTVVNKTIIIPRKVEPVKIAPVQPPPIKPSVPVAPVRQFKPSPQVNRPTFNFPKQQSRPSFSSGRSSFKSSSSFSSKRR